MKLSIIILIFLCSCSSVKQLPDRQPDPIAQKQKEKEFRAIVFIVIAGYFIGSYAFDGYH